MTTQAQIDAAITAHGAAKVHGAAYKAMQGGAARQALAAVGLPTDGTIADLDRIGAAAFARMTPNDRAADLMGARVEAGSGEDHDTGRVESVEGSTAFVSWDSGVKTRANVDSLRLI